MLVEDHQKGVYVPDLIEKNIQNQQEVIELIKIGNQRRQTANMV